MGDVKLWSSRHHYRRYFRHYYRRYRYRRYHRRSGSNVEKK
jgi:hypothetical protein